MVINFTNVTDKAGISKLHDDLRNSDPQLVLQALEKVKESVATCSTEEVKVYAKLVLTALLNSSCKSSINQKFSRTLEDISHHRNEAYIEGINEVIASRLNSLNPSDTAVLISLYNESTQLFRGTSFETNPNMNLFAVVHEQCDKMWQNALSESIPTYEKSELYSILLRIVKSVCSILHKRLQTITTKFSVRLVQQSIAICSCNGLPLDLYNAYGVLIVKICCLNTWSLIDVVQGAINRESYFKHVTHVGLLAVFHGVLCQSLPKNIIEVTDNFDIAGAMFEVIDIKSLNNTETILSCRIINHLMMKLVNAVDDTDVNFHSRYHIASEFSKEFVFSILTMWDHFLDSVKHLARDIFLNYIKFHSIYDELEAQNSFRQLSKILLKDLQTKKYAYVALSYLIPIVKASSVMQDNLPVQLIRKMNDPTYATHAHALLLSLFEQHALEVPTEQWRETWFEAFFDNYSESMIPYGYENLIVKLLSCKPNCAYMAIEKLSNYQDTKTRQNLLVICAKALLKIQSKNKLPNRFVQRNSSMWKQIISYDNMTAILSSHDENTAILAFNLICETAKTTQLFEKIELQWIHEFLTRNITKSTPSFQQKLLNNFKKIFNRINSGLLQKSKQLKSVKNSYGATDVINLHEHFLRNILITLMNNLHYGANPSRTFLSLSLMRLLIELTIEGNACMFHQREELYSNELTNTLLFTLLDDYESNKIIASQLLTQIMLVNKPSNELLKQLIKYIWNYASSCKPPNTITASYLITCVVTITDIHTTEDIPVCDNNRLSAAWCVLKRLQIEVTCAEKNIFKAATSSPMYGLLQALRYIMASVQKTDLNESWQPIVTPIVSTCLSCLSVVEPIVNNESPEGHLPMDFCRENLPLLKNIIEKSFIGQDLLDNGDVTETELVKAQAVTSQMLLLCGWRSIKELSLLLSEIVKLVNIGGLDTVITRSQIQQIGNVFLTLLINTIHRGAFEQANVGFNSICGTLWKVPIAEIAQLPEKWLEETLKAVGDVEHPRLCATRRSAGLPFIIQSILGTEPSCRSGKSLKLAMTQLLAYARGTDSESKVHALNIMRLLFREARLSDYIMEFVSPAVQITLEIYKSCQWAERNAATLLLSSLFNRMIGIKRTQDDIHTKNSISAQVFFTRFPKLETLFLNELKLSTDNISEGKLSLSAYPVLMILARLAPVTFEGLDSKVHLDSFHPLVLKCCSSPIYQLRVLASKALISLLTPFDATKNIMKLYADVSFTNQNFLHGAFLCLKQIIMNFREHLKGNLTVLDHISRLSWVARDSNKCFVSRAAALDMFAVMFKSGLINDQSLLSTLSASSLSLLLSIGRHNHREIGAYVALRSSATFLLDTNQNFNDINTYTFLFDSPLQQAKQIAYEHACNLDILPAVLVDFVAHKTLATNGPILIRSMMYSVLLKAFQNGHTCQLKLLDKSIEDLSNSRADDSIGSIIHVSGYLIKTSVEDNSIESKLDVWIDLLARFSDAENCVTIRRSVIEALKIAVPYCSGNCALVKILIELVTDDEADVRNGACDISEKLLGKDHQIREPILARLIHHLVSIGGADVISALFLMALAEREPEEFGLSEDRAFDRSETNIYKQQFEIAKISSSVLSTLVKSRDQHVLLNIQDAFLLPIPLNDIQNELITVKTIVKLLVRDIEYILDQFGVVCLELPQLWYGRLTKRAYLFNAIKTYGCHVVDATSLQPLSKCIIKSAHVNKVISMLS